MAGLSYTQIAQNSLYAYSSLNEAEGRIALMTQNATDHSCCVTMIDNGGSRRWLAGEGDVELTKGALPSLTDKKSLLCNRRQSIALDSVAAGITATESARTPVRTIDLDAFHVHQYMEPAG